MAAGQSDILERQNIQESFHTLLFSWVGGTVATAPDCKSGTQETSEVRVLSCPLYKNKNIKRKLVNKWELMILIDL